jgi:hypothetical protein
MAGGTSFYFSYAINHLPDNVSFQLVTKLGEGEMKAIICATFPLERRPISPALQTLLPMAAGLTR